MRVRPMRYLTCMCFRLASNTLVCLARAMHVQLCMCVYVCACRVQAEEDVAEPERHAAQHPRRHRVPRADPLLERAAPGARCVSSPPPAPASHALSSHSHTHSRTLSHPRTCSSHSHVCSPSRASVKCLCTRTRVPVCLRSCSRALTAALACRLDEADRHRASRVRRPGASYSY